MTPSRLEETCEVNLVRKIVTRPVSNLLQTLWGHLVRSHHQALLWVYGSRLPHVLPLCRIAWDGPSALGPRSLLVIKEKD